MTTCGLVLGRDFSHEAASQMRLLQARPKAVRIENRGTSSRHS